MHCNPFPGRRLLLTHTLDGCTKSESADYIVVLCSTVHRLPINHHVSGYNPPAWTRTRLCCSATDGIRFAFFPRPAEGGSIVLLMVEWTAETHEKNVESFQVAGHHRERWHIRGHSLVSNYHEQQQQRLKDSTSSLSSVSWSLDENFCKEDTTIRVLSSLECDFVRYATLH